MAYSILPSYAWVIYIGCETASSNDSYYLRRRGLGSPPPNPPNFRFELPDSSCFTDALRISEGVYLGVQIDQSPTSERQLTRISASIEDDEAILETLGELPDNTVSIARGPAPPSNVPTLSKWALKFSVLLIVLLGGWSLRNRIV